MREKLALVLLICGCAKSEASTTTTTTASPAASMSTATAQQSSAPPLIVGAAADPSQGSGVRPTTATAPKVYKKVLHTGDSMVGGGLARALRPKVEAEGAKYVRDVWESGSLRDFSRSDRIPNLLAAHHPDLVILTLGANDVYEKEPEVLAPFIEKIAKLATAKGTVDCVWVGPPFWKKEYERMVDTFKKHVAPCQFFDSSGIEMERKKDGIHPDEKGGEQWADALWKGLGRGG